MNVTNVTIELLHSHLTNHMQSVHEGVNNEHNQCDYIATI